MKICVTARFSTSSQNQQDIEALCTAVRQAGARDFCFIRDVEHYQHIFDDPRQLWQRTKAEIMQCDALLIDTTDNPTGGRIIEVGMAYALGQPIFVIARRGTQYKQIFDGIAHQIIFYDTYDDVTKALREALVSNPMR